MIQNLFLEKQKLIDLLATKELQEKTITQKLNKSLEDINDLLLTSNCNDRISFHKKNLCAAKSRNSMSASLCVAECLPVNSLVRAKHLSYFKVSIQLIHFLGYSKLYSQCMW